MNLFKKIRRELTVGLSKISLKRSSSNYLGLKLKFPVIYGMGGDYFLAKELWLGECLKGLTSLKSGAVIDVGVNVGLLLVKLRVFDKTRQYYGFEPNPSALFYCQELMRLNKFENSVILPYGLSNEEKFTDLFARKRGDGRATILKQAIENPDKIDFSTKIRIFTGDHIIEKLLLNEISVIKIDVEGAELEVLKGLKDTLKKFRPFGYCEIWPMTDSKDSNEIERKGRLVDIFDYMSSIEYTVLGKKNTGEVDEILSPEQMSVEYDQNYILSPKEDSAKAIDRLAG